MFATRRTMMPLAEATRHQRSLARLVLTLFAVSALLVLCSGCGPAGTRKSAVTAPLAHAPSVRQVRVHLAPTPAISTAVRTAQRHLYPFAQANIGLMQPAVDAQGTVWVGEMHTNRLGRLNSHRGVVTSWVPPGAQDGIMTTTVDAHGTPGLLSRTPITSGTLRRGSRRFASSRWARGMGAPSDHKTCNSMTRGCSGLPQ